MIKTEKVSQVQKTKKEFKKDWKVVLFFGERLYPCKSVQVIEIPSSKSRPHAFMTEPILSVDFVNDDISMFNTGPCRYIALDAMYYAGQNLPLAFSDSKPHLYSTINIKIVSLDSTTSGFFETFVFVTDLKKIKENLYHVYTEGDDYYVTVEED